MKSQFITSPPPPPPQVGVRSIAMSVSVCMPLCLSASVSQATHAQTSQNVLYVLAEAVLQSS